jgi:hypothetical protein
MELPDLPADFPEHPTDMIRIERDRLELQHLLRYLSFE